MADLDRVKRNISRMISMNAPEADIDGYIASEGVTLDQVRAHKMGAAPAAVDPKTAAADKAVADQRAARPVGAYVSDVARNLARGLPFGSYADELKAGVWSAIQGRPYADVKRDVDAQDRAAAADTTTLGTLPLVGDVTTGGLASLGAGIATAPLAPVARIFQGGAMLPRIGNYLATGAGYGALYGSGEGEGSERAYNALMGAGVGGTVGALAPVAGAAVGNAVRGIADRARPLPQGVRNFGRPAVNRMTEFVEMDNLTPQGVRQELNRLGPEGMLADVGPNMRVAAESLAQQPGPGRQRVTEALNYRQEGAPGRIAADVDVALGPAANLPATIQATEQHYRQAARPFYEAFYETEVPQTRQLRNVIGQVQRSAPGAFRKAQNLAVAEGVNPRYLLRLQEDPMAAMTGAGQRAVRGQRQWTPVELDYLKRAVDDIARNAAPGSNEARIYGNLARSLRTTVDESISPGAPADSPWAQARGVAEEGFNIQDAIEGGRTAFNRATSADQLAANMQGMSQVEQAGTRLGMREAVRSNMDMAATNFRPNGDAAARRMLNSPENRRKLAMGAETPQGAQQLINRIDAENDMAETFNQVMTNSATARRLAARDIIPRQYEASAGREMRGTSLTGLASEGVSRLFNFLAARALNERNARVAMEMADMAVAQGARRDQIAQGLLEMMQRQRMSAAQRNQISRFAQNLVRGTTAPAVGAVSDAKANP